VFGGGADFNGWESLALPSPLVLAPARSIVTIFIIFIYVASTLPRNPGHLASRDWSCRDAGQHGTNPGNPGKSGTGGNPIECTCLFHIGPL